MSSYQLYPRNCVEIAQFPSWLDFYSKVALLFHVAGRLEAGGAAWALKRTAALAHTQIDCIQHS